MAVIEITGLDDFYDLLKNLDEETTAEVKGAIDKHAELVRYTAQTLVPKDSGLLHSSIGVKKSKSGLFATVGTNAKTAPHGHLVHFGTVKMTGRPFIYQAAERHERQFDQQFEKLMDDIVERNR